jgi:hypothetical protein
MYRELKGENALALASPLIELSEVRMSVGDAESEVLARRALEIRRKRLPSEHPDVIRAQVQLARTLLANSRTEEAESLLQSTVRFVRNPPFPLPAWQIGEAESGLGWSAGMLGRKSEAQALLRAAHSKLVNHPRPLYRHEAALHLKSLGLENSR